MSHVFSSMMRDIIYSVIITAFRNGFLQEEIKEVLLDAYNDAWADFSYEQHKAREGH